MRLPGRASAQGNRDRQLENPFRRRPTIMSITPQQAKAQLDAHVRETVEWHFNTETGSPFWVAAAAGKNPLCKLGCDPRRDVKCFEDLQKFGLFEDDWLRG